MGRAPDGFTYNEEVAEGKPGGFKFVTLPATDASNRKSKSQLPSAARNHVGVVGKIVIDHAVETFGSERIARNWLSGACGALNNRTPLQVIQGEGEAEVERILDCIDYGMLA